MSERRVGFVIGSVHGDFLCHVERGKGRNQGRDGFSYAPHPDLALRYRRLGQAQKVVDFIAKPGVRVLPLYEDGDKWLVEWPEEWLKEWGVV